MTVSPISRGFEVVETRIDLFGSSGKRGPETLYELRHDSNGDPLDKNSSSLRVSYS